ncbi:MAG TPA: methylmalonyl-CoA mutase family protein [Actinomycetota bacterium]|nr:methylmalonyl-CoA mutase family protein [Actinomycetota bacterium]
MTDAGIEIAATYGPDSLPGWDPDTDLGAPGTFPFTRGVHPAMYRDRLWTMRQYSGFGTAEQTNERFKFLLEQGQTGLSVAFDLPTQMGYDSDHPRATGEVGGTGVAISTLADMEILLRDIPLDFVSTSMTINATAPILLVAYELVAGRAGVAPDRIRGTVQNDILKEYAARGCYIFPPRPSMRLVTDLFAYCQERIPRWNVISISGYHMREAGCTAVQEVAFTLANAVAYLKAAVEAGLAPPDLARRISFFFACHMNFFEEVAKFRAARRMWARIMRQAFGAHEEDAWLRFHTQTGGATLTAQQPENNIVRTAYEALAAVLGGTQSLHTNSYDEALSLPSEAAARLALRTQQVLGFETGVVDTVDPLGGSWFVERLTNEIEKQAEALLARIEDMGGAVAAVETGWVKAQIEESAYRMQLAIEEQRKVVVGVNRFVESDPAPPVAHPDREAVQTQLARLARVKASRDPAAVRSALEDVRAVARGTANLLHPIREALSASATLGEICDVLRDVFGEYRPTEVF